MRYLFTSESVGEGHPDKLCDQISDAVLDEALRQDPKARVACEVMATNGVIIIGGEMTVDGYIDIQSVARGVIKSIGYTDPDYGLDYKSCGILLNINSQSQDIAIGVDEDPTKNKDIGAGDQGMMFGYACDETPELMPAPIMFAHKIMLKAAEVRKCGVLPFLRPDGKCQVTVEYDGEKIKRIHTVVLSHQHDEDVPYATLKNELIEKVIKEALPKELFDDKTIYYINPTGRFVIGGPQGDTGLTGRKIVVDTYGGMGRVGGGAFSGKDPTKVDRSAAYMARYIAKNIVAAKIARKCEIELAYAIGISHPVSININFFGTGNISEEKVEKIIPDIFPLTPHGIIDYLDLRKPIYKETATYGHFGRSKFNWEKTDKVDELLKKLK
ncbi:MAG: methionine adenosyltransferase [Spirochaetes bacterium]|nr:methionine adenosyltransferase [Spirochaetota bacterium]